MPEQHEILILGPENAGKTQLVNRLLNKKFNPNEGSTVGIALDKQYISATRTIVYRDVAADSLVTTFERYFCSSHQIYLVFNASDNNGLSALRNYIENFEFPDSAKITLIGTHTDLGITTLTENETYAAELGGEYYSISSKDKNNVNIERLLSTSSELPTQVLQQTQTNRRRSVDGSINQDGTGTSVMGLSSVRLRQFNLKKKEQDIGEYIVTEYRFEEQSSSHDTRGSEKGEKKEVSGYNCNESAILPSQEAKQGTSNNNLIQSSQNTSVSNLIRGMQQHHRRQSSTRNPLPTPASANTTPAPENRYSFAFRMAGIAMILAAVIGLIYTALVVVNILTATTLISVMNHIVVGIGSLLGASTSTNIVTIAASLNVSKTAVAAMLMTVPIVALLAVGFGVFRAGQKPVANNQNTDSTMLHNSYQ